MLLSEIFALLWISLDIVEFFAFDQSPACCHRGADLPQVTWLAIPIAAMHLRVQGSFFPGRVGIGDQWGE